MRDLFVVISGIPGAGKTTLAKPLADALGFPLFAKDVIKEATADAIPAEDREASGRLGWAATEVLFALMHANARGVVENAWIPDLARERLTAFSNLVEVFCAVPTDVAMARFAEHAGSRHVVHFDAEQVGDFERVAIRNVPIGGEWPVITVDTTGPVDIGALVAQIGAL